MQVLKKICELCRVETGRRNKDRPIRPGNMIKSPFVHYVSF